MGLGHILQLVVPMDLLMGSLFLSGFPVDTSRIKWGASFECTHFCMRSYPGLFETHLSIYALLVSPRKEGLAWP